jgi:hypothetical protein
MRKPSIMRLGLAVLAAFTLALSGAGVASATGEIFPETGRPIPCNPFSAPFDCDPNNWTGVEVDCPAQGTGFPGQFNVPAPEPGPCEFDVNLPLLRLSVTAPATPIITCDVTLGDGDGDGDGHAGVWRDGETQVPEVTVANATSTCVGVITINNLTWANQFCEYHPEGQGARYFDGLYIDFNLGAQRLAGWVQVEYLNPAGATPGQFIADSLEVAVRPAGTLLDSNRNLTDLSRADHTVDVNGLFTVESVDTPCAWTFD